jgi:hypothetical protein
MVAPWLGLEGVLLLASFRDERNCTLNLPDAAFGWMVG